MAIDNGSVFGISSGDTTLSATDLAGGLQILDISRGTNTPVNSGTAYLIALFTSALNSVTFSTSAGVGPRVFMFSVSDAQYLSNSAQPGQINVV